MATATFDTLKFVERLEKAGVTREQASAIVEAQKDALSEALDSTLATKSDLHGIELAIASLRLATAGVQGEMFSLKWMIGVLVALAIANFAKQFF